MSDDDDVREGWHAPQRAPMLTALGVIGVLMVALFGFGRLYAVRIAERTHPPVATFPAPRLETIQTAPRERRRLNQSPPPRGIDRAMAEVAGQGDALWGPARP